MSLHTLSHEARLVLGANLVAARERAGLKQGEAVTRSGVPRDRLSPWENGHAAPNIEGLLRLAIAYGCPVDDFLGGVDEGYDAIIERRIPVDARRHYEARTNTFIQRITAGMQLALTPGAPAPTPGARVAARPTVGGKSKPARARRERGKKKR